MNKLKIWVHCGTKMKSFFNIGQPKAYYSKLSKTVPKKKNMIYEPCKGKRVICNGQKIYLIRCMSAIIWIPVAIIC